MAGSNTTLHLATVPPIPTMTDTLPASARMDGHIPLPSPALFDDYIITCVLLLLVTTLAVGGKFALTWKGRRRFGVDDAMIAAGWVSGHWAEGAGARAVKAC